MPRHEHRGRRHVSSFAPILVLLSVACAFDPIPASAQEPADSTAADTIPAPEVPSADTVTAPGLPAESPGADTIPLDSLPSDSLPADSVAAADTIRIEHFPEAPSAAPTGWETGIWAWDREGLLASRASTLGELLGDVPGVLQLRGGDYGMPRAATAFGAGGGGVRVFRDGLEILPLEGSVVDLTRIGLAGVDEVRVERTGAGLRVELRSLQIDDPRPYSLVEAGTGDLDTNLLRGVFFHPRALGGNAGLSLERQDTRGPDRQEPGAATSVWLHYAYLLDDRFGVAADLARSTTSRDTLFVPNQVTRTDLRLRSRWRPTAGVVADLFWSRATLEADSTEDGLQPFPFRSEARGEWGARIAAEAGPVSGRLTYRDPRGEGLAERRSSAELVARLPGVGGAAGSWRGAWWGGRTTSTVGLRAWTEPRWGLSAFASWEDFEDGVPALPPGPPEDDGEGASPAATPRFSEGRILRAGGRFRWRDLDLSGARLAVERDSVHPLGLPMDRNGPSIAGGERGGWEVAFRVPLLLLDGLSLEGGGQLWEETSDPWPYFPRRSWHAALSHHRTYLPTENLEVWLDIGVQGRDAMTVTLPASSEPEPGDGGSGSAVSPIRRGADAGSSGEGVAGVFSSRTPAPSSLLQAGGPAGVPFYQSFYARLQIRVVSVRVFVSWENFTVRDVNQDFPGRILPRTRAMYGVRWTLWN